MSRLRRRWMVVVTGQPDGSFDLGTHYWTRRGARKAARRRNRRIARPADPRIHWEPAQVGEYPGWAAA